MPKKSDQQVRTMAALGALAVEQAAAAGERFMAGYAEMRRHRRAADAALERIADPLADWHVIEIEEHKARDVVLDLTRRRLTPYRPERMVREHVARGRGLVPRLVARSFYPGYLFARFDAAVQISSEELATLQRGGVRVANREWAEWNRPSVADAAAARDVFVKISHRAERQWSPLLAVDGVLGVLVLAGTRVPATVPVNDMAAIVAKERELDQLRRVRRRLAGFPFDVGDEVRVVDGAFSAAVGFIERLLSKGRIKVAVPGVMGRTVSIEVDADQIGAL